MQRKKKIIKNKKENKMENWKKDFEKWWSTLDLAQFNGCNYKTTAMFAWKAAKESNRLEKVVSGEFAEENEKLIKWFMELAVIMKEDGYTLESLLSIDVSAWIEMFQQHGETPQNAYLEDLSNA